MIKNIKKNPFFYITLSFFLLMVLWWVWIRYIGIVNTKQNYLYGLALGILPILGAIGGFLNSKKWGGVKSSLGKSITFLSSGLFIWGIGTLVFAYYNIYLNIEAPYPSIADAFYIISWPLWILGMFYLSKATGAKFGIKQKSGKIALLIIPILISILSYYLLINFAGGGIPDYKLSFLETFFYLAYPIGDVLILTTALLLYKLSFNYFGGKFKAAIVTILLGFVVNYFADFSFTFTITRETYFVGNWVDLIFTIAMFLLSMGVIMFNYTTTNDELTQSNYD